MPTTSSLEHRETPTASRPLYSSTLLFMNDMVDAYSPATPTRFNRTDSTYCSDFALLVHDLKCLVVIFRKRRQLMHRNDVVQHNRRIDQRFVEYRSDVSSRSRHGTSTTDLITWTRNSGNPHGHQIPNSPYIMPLLLTTPCTTSSTAPNDLRG